eukprot:COSAG01_NODE_1342_length_10639_cov_81.961206_1_plen_191_part_00
MKSVAAIRQTQAALFSAASDRYGKASPGKTRVNKTTSVESADTDQLKKDIQDIAKCELRIKKIQQKIAGGDFIDARDRQRLISCMGELRNVAAQRRAMLPPDVVLASGSLGFIATKPGTKFDHGAVRKAADAGDWTEVARLCDGTPIPVGNGDSDALAELRRAALSNTLQGKKQPLVLWKRGHRQSVIGC